eukprot:COSAG05_NODE_324_length_11401_cov_6.009379_9_plen_73_part_00
MQCARGLVWGFPHLAALAGVVADGVGVQRLRRADQPGVEARAEADMQRPACVDVPTGRMQLSMLHLDARAIC